MRTKTRSGIMRAIFVEPIITAVLMFGNVCVSNAAENNAPWPPIYIIDNNAPIGTILWETALTTPVLEMDRTQKTNIGVLHLRGASVSVESPAGSGTYELLGGDGKPSGIAISVEGTWDIEQTNSTNKLCTHTKTNYTDFNGINDSIGFNVLIGCVPSKFTNNIKSVFNGRILLIKTRNTLNLEGVRLGEIVASWRDQNGWQDGSFLFGKGGVEIETFRKCSVEVSNTNVNFGAIAASPGIVGELSKKSSSLFFACEGSNLSEENTVNIKVVPTFAVADDMKAIGLQIGGALSDNLVVRAFSQYASDISCDSAEAIEMEVPTKLEELPAGSAVSKNAHIFWTLCKKRPEALPSGEIKGSATLQFDID